MGKSAIYKELKAMADKLPVVYEPWEGSFITTGSLIKAMTGNDEVDTDMAYVRKVEKRMVNHFKRMKRKYDKGGMAAVNKYVDLILVNANRKN